MNKYINNSLNLNVGWINLMICFIFNLSSTSCTDTEIYDEQKMTPLVVSASIHNNTRAMITSSSFDNNTSIGVTVVDNSNQSYDDNDYSNLKFTVSKEGDVETWSTSKTINLSLNKATVYATYPYTNNNSDIRAITVYSGDTDYMFAKNTASYENPSVNLIFEHTLHAFNINICKKGYGGDGVVSNISLTSPVFASSKTVDMVEGTVSYSGVNSALNVPILYNTIADSYTQIGQIMAVSTETDEQPVSLTFDITVDGKNYNLVIADIYNHFPNGYTTDINIDLLPTGLKFADIQVVPWGYSNLSNQNIQVTQNVNVCGNLNGIALNNKINDDGSLTITAVPIEPYSIVSEITYSGDATLNQSIDYSTGVLTATISNINDVVNIEFQGVVLSLVAKYYVSEEELAANPTGVTKKIYNSTWNIKFITINNDLVDKNNNYTFTSAGEHLVFFGLKDATIKNSMFDECVGLTEITIPNSVTSIENFAFDGCTGLKSAVIGSGVQTIGDYAFRECTGLTEITIPNSVTNIGESAFYGCSGLTSVVIGSGVQTIGEYAFLACSGLTEITIPNSVTAIGNYAFEGCTGLTGTLTIPNSVTAIGNFAFSSCEGLTEVTIGSGVQTIGEHAFFDCKELKSLVIGSGVQTIGEDVFGRCWELAEIISLAMTAPSIQYNTFFSVKSNGTLTVPTGATGYDTWMQTDNYYLGKYNWNKIEQ